MWRFEEKAGIRENGETYGTEIFRCQTKGCKWKTSFKYDDKGRNMFVLRVKDTKLVDVFFSLGNWECLSFVVLGTCPLN